MKFRYLVASYQESIHQVTQSIKTVIPWQAGTKGFVNSGSKAGKSILNKIKRMFFHKVQFYNKLILQFCVSATKAFRTTHLGSKALIPESISYIFKFPCVTKLIDE